VSSMLTVKLRRDLRATWSRIVMMVVAIAVGLTVFSAVLYAWSTINRETEKAYLSTEPASATILLNRGIAAQEMAAIAAEARKRPGVIEATGRTQFTSDIRVDGRELDNRLQVFVAAPDDPLRMARFEVQPGRWPPAPDEILLERDSLGLLDLAVGDTVAIETPGGEAARLRVAGAVYDPSLAPADQEQTGRAYLSAAALAGPGRQAVLDQLKIQVAGPGQTAPSRDRDAIVAVAGDVGRWLQREYGLGIRELQVPKPYEHPHQGITNAILGALLVGAAAALLLSTFLVANMLNGLFSQQIPQIGIMKAIGARSGRIGRLYLAMTLTVAGAAILLALAPGILIGRAFASVILDFLGIEGASLGAAWWTYLLVLAAGLVLPPIMALVPLVRTARTTVRAAIDHHGLGSNLGAATGIVARLGRIRGLNRGLLMALRNTIRRPARFLLTVGLLASAGMLFVAGMSTRDGLEAATEERTEQIRSDVVVQLASARSVDELATIVERVPQVSRVEAWTIAESAVAGQGQIPVTSTYPDQGHGRLAVTAIPSDTTMFTPPKLLEGRWLNSNETGAIVLNQVAVANADLDIEVGDTVELFVDGRPARWRVAGIAQERGANSAAYVTAEGLAEATGRPPRANTLRIATDSDDEQTRRAVAATVSKNLTEAGVAVRSAESVAEEEASAESHRGPIVFVLVAGAIALGVIGLIGLSSTMGANVLERTREFGVMHAIGARPAAVRRIVVAEGVFLALASCLLAAIPTLGLTAAMGAVIGNAFVSAPLPFQISVLGAGIWTVLVVLGAVLATDAAATRASHLTVREALAYL
jgi:putative ABC transport system permease protein